MAISPKVKILTGVAAIGGGSFGLYNAYKSTGGKRIIYGIAGAVLLLGGIYYTRKSYADLKSASAPADDQKSKIVKAPVKIDEESSGTGSTIITIPAETPDQNQVISQNTNTGTVSTKSNSRTVSRKADKSNADGVKEKKPKAFTQAEINNRNEKKRQIQARITELNRQIPGLPPDSDGRATKLAINNELALLTAQLRLI